VTAMRAGRMAAVLGAVLALAVAACGGDGAAATSTPEGCRSLDVVVTTSILGDVVSQVAGEGAAVAVLMPLGADPHSFQASASQAAALREADLVVVNGLGLEEGLDDVIAGAAADGVSVVVAASFVDTLPFVAVAAGEAGDPGDLDPHFWTDPRRMAEVAVGIGEALAAADPACAAARRDAAAAYRAELLGLDAEIEGILAGIPAEGRKLVTNHRTLGYFADRYGFEVVGAIIPGGTTLAEPSPADLAELAEALRREGVRAIFTESTRPAALAEALAGELGEQVAVVGLYTESLGPPGSGAETYAAMQWVNAERIAAALGGT
jgi:zinc/manganese transport system substrate-binding protein